MGENQYYSCTDTVSAIVLDDRCCPHNASTILILIFVVVFVVIVKYKSWLISIALSKISTYIFYNECQLASLLFER